MPDWISDYVAAIRAAYPSGLPLEIAAYLETFERDSDANRAAREQRWYEIDPQTRERLIDLHKTVNPQLFS